MGFLVKFSENNAEDLHFILDIATETIIQGKILSFPTDSVYGIGGDPSNPMVVEKLYNIKFREKSKGFIVLVCDVEEAQKVANLNDIAEKLAEHFWPGELTLILPKKNTNFIPPEVTAFKNTIGIRIPKNKVILSILKKLKALSRFGGIIGTSANYSGEPPAISGEEVVKKLLNPIDLIIDVGKTKSQIPTTIIDCTTAIPKILRQGLIQKEEIEEILHIEMSGGN